ncbi:hypothetical protein HPB48_016010 [Haemaphysalis longicornis]|uniref:Uncharacterized protein n=1 Tax=Haemaphysalis longicornis TaxID=44386 RepID=A0A9J6FRZ2_HAELO|nr:hypothetical protein HPB48_016010 [Haemaphysalis longicornis]
MVSELHTSGEWRRDDGSPTRKAGLTRCLGGTTIGSSDDWVVEGAASDPASAVATSTRRRRPRAVSYTKAALPPSEASSVSCTSLAQSLDA